MSTFRLSRVALNARQATLRTAIQRRGYAEAVSDKIKLSLALPHQVRVHCLIVSFGWLQDLTWTVLVL